MSSSEPEKKPCRHEYVRIFQRRLRGHERRLVATRAYLPVGFKMGDLDHLSAGSFCFCITCRKRLFPKRTQAEKDRAREERRRAKQLAQQEAAAENGEEAVAEGGIDMSMLATPMPKGSLTAGSSAFKALVGASDEDDDEEEVEESQEEETEDDAVVDVHVDELEVESVDVEDIKAEGVKLSSDDDYSDSCSEDDEDT